MPFEGDEPMFEAVGFVMDGFLVDVVGVSNIALHQLERLAEWSDWVHFAEAPAMAPKRPGVYMAREGSSGGIAYIGWRVSAMATACEAASLSIHRKALVSGLDEAVFDRDLADVEWLRQRPASSPRLVGRERRA